MSFSLSGMGSIITTLTNAGVTPANAITAAKSLLAGNTALRSTLQGLTNQMVVNQGNPANVQRLAQTIETTPGATPIIISAAQAVGAATTPADFVSGINALETQINAL